MWCIILQPDFSLRSIEGSIATMTNQHPPKQFPIFKVGSFSAYRHEHFQCVVVDNQVLHRICDVNAFYKTFGYTTDIGTTASPDEYLWESFTRPGAPHSQDCLQPLVISYLHKHSREFRGKYTNAYQNEIGTCRLDTLSSTRFCRDCFKHPDAIK